MKNNQLSKSKAIKYLDEQGKLLIRLGKDPNGDVCVQIIMNISLAELIERASK